MTVCIHMMFWTSWKEVVLTSRRAEMSVFSKHGLFKYMIWLCGKSHKFRTDRFLKKKRNVRVKTFIWCELAFYMTAFSHYTVIFFNKPEAMVKTLSQIMLTVHRWDTPFARNYLPQIIYLDHSLIILQLSVHIWFLNVVYYDYSI